LNTMLRVKVWLRLFRAQTAPATALVILLPYLAVGGAVFLSWKTLALALYATLLHWWTFGHNSLMDCAMGYDEKDPSKSHHPLPGKDISLHDAHNTIHWGLALLMVAGAVTSTAIGANPLLATTCLLLYAALGHAYNDGLSKETIHGWLPISACFSALAGFGWFLGHTGINWLGCAFLAYVFLTQVFEIGWEGNLKELAVAGQVERENLLRRMGATIQTYTPVVDQHETAWIPHYRFEPGSSRIFGLAVKMAAWTLASVIILAAQQALLIMWWICLTAAVVAFLTFLTEPREFNRANELRAMSAMEIVSIYFPIPILVNWPVAIVLMLAGITYFYGMNKFIWGVDYPKV